MDKYADADRMLGFHLKFQGNLSKTMRFAAANKMLATQFFMGSNRTYQRTIIEQEDLAEAKKLQETHELDLFTHLPYIYNLAGSVKKRTLAWDGCEKEDRQKRVLIQSLEYELGVMANFMTSECRSGCCIHLGSWPEKEKGLQTVAKTINKINFAKDTRLIFETMVEKGNTLGRNFEELKYVYERCERQDHLQICIDTCHVYANGLYDLSKNEEVDRMFKEFLSTFATLDKLALVHFNDSRYPFGSKKDNHTFIGKGCIWHDKDTTLSYFWEKVNHLKIPCVSETDFGAYFSPLVIDF